MSAPVVIEPERIALVTAAVKHTVPASIVQDAELSVSVLAGGITNQLYRVKFKRPDNSDSNAVSVVVRVYGAETERLISREAEKFFQGIFLHTYGAYQNALVYEFLDGMRALEPDELPGFADSIARCLAVFQRTATAKIDTGSIYATQQLHSINTTREWLDVATQACTNRPEKLAALKVDLETKLKPACDWMHRVLIKTLEAAADRRNQDVLFVAICHNDLLSGNVMVRSEAKRGDDAESGATAAVRFIDFEYCRRDFALYDIADHWTEWAGYNNDFSKYPDAVAQRKFITAFFEARGDITASTPEDTANELVSRAVVTTNFLSLASALAWAVWSIVQHAYSAIDFDYVEYYKTKFQRFLDKREEYTAPFVANVLKLNPAEFAKM